MAHPHVLLIWKSVVVVPPPPPWKEPLSTQRVIPQNRAGIPLDMVFCKIKLFLKISVFRKIKLFHKIAVFRKLKLFRSVTHFLYSACIPQNPVSYFKFLLSSKWWHHRIRPIVGWFKFQYNNRNQHYKLPLHTKLKLQTLLCHQDISDFMFSLSSKWWRHQMLLIWQLIQVSTSQTKSAPWTTLPLHAKFQPRTSVCTQDTSNFMFSISSKW